MTPEQAQKLREPFKPEQIGKLPKLTCKDCSQSQAKVCAKHSKSRCQTCGNYISSAHLHLDYVGHAATTDRLLSVDPEWTWEPMGYGPNGEPLMTNGGMWIKLTLCGVTRPGFGDGGSPKEIIGDAIRNAAMRFGVALDLWAKEDLHAEDSAGEPKADTNGAPQPPVSREPVGTDEPASPAEEESFTEKAARAQAAGPKATKQQLAEIHSLVDTCAAARGSTVEKVWAALENDGYDLGELRKAQAEALIEKLNRWASTLAAA